VSRAGAHLEQATRATGSQQVKEAPPLVNLERLPLPAVASGRRGRPVRAAKAGNDPGVLLHGHDRIVAAASSRSPPTGKACPYTGMPATNGRYNAITTITEHH